MSLNLIDDRWIPVVLGDGSRRQVAPWEIAHPDIIDVDWPRPDLNVACYELLIGLVYMADPPTNMGQWRQRQAPDAERLRAKLAPYAPAFNLLGEGPLFLQDLEPLQADPNSVDMLFIDSAGGNTAKNNADLMVHRNRYKQLDLPLAAMALYAFQAHAPSGGAGNRTSMRGGGPLVTLVDPQSGLWDLVWANVPLGTPSSKEDLPWMRATRVSDTGAQTYPPADRSLSVEAFFGMPRRLRLKAEGQQVTGVVQRPWGTNYSGWKHPLTPYYRMKVTEEWLPKHPRAGRFGYRNWLGVIAEERRDGDALSELAHSVQLWGHRRGGGAVLVAGWAMDNMRPLDFVLSRQPLIELSDEAEWLLVGLVKAAEAAAVALRGALEPILKEGEAREAEREAFYLATEGAFLVQMQALHKGEDVRREWLQTLRRQAMHQFDRLALPGMDQHDSQHIERIVMARKFLGLAFSGYGKQGANLFQALDLPVPVVKKGKAA